MECAGRESMLHMLKWALNQTTMMLAGCLLSIWGCALIKANHAELEHDGHTG